MAGHLVAPDGSGDGLARRRVLTRVAEEHGLSCGELSDVRRFPAGAEPTPGDSARPAQRRVVGLWESAPHEQVDLVLRSSSARTVAGEASADEKAPRQTGHGALRLTGGAARTQAQRISKGTGARIRAQRMQFSESQRTRAAPGSCGGRRAVRPKLKGYKKVAAEARPGRRAAPSDGLIPHLELWRAAQILMHSEQKL